MPLQRQPPKEQILCAVNSKSFVIFPLALCLSLILSLRNLMDATSANLRAGLVVTGGHIDRSLGTLGFPIHKIS